MQANAYSPYALKDLHLAIDLIDRKITHSSSLESFESQEAREVHLRKLASKRAALVKSALALAAMGVQCDPQFLPRSFVQSAQAEANSAGDGAPVAEGAKTIKATTTRRKRS
jgi:hypothetical protein